VVTVSLAKRNRWKDVSELETGKLFWITVRFGSIGVGIDTKSHSVFLMELQGKVFSTTGEMKEKVDRCKFRMRIRTKCPISNVLSDGNLAVPARPDVI